MPKVNLLPKQGLEQKPLGKFLQWTLSYGRYIIISVELIVFMVFFSRFIYDRQLQDLNESIEQKEAIVVSAQEFEQQFRMLQNKMKLVESLDENRTIYIDLLETLKRITPQNVYYDSIDFDDTKIILSGTASNNESFAQFLASVTGEDFIEVSLDSLEKSDEDTTISFSTTIVYQEAENSTETQTSTEQQPVTSTEES